MRKEAALILGIPEKNKNVTFFNINNHLISACQRAKIQKVEELLKQGADPNFINSYDHTPIYDAILYKHPNDSNENSEQDVTLKLVKLLYKYEANIEFKDNDGNTLLLIAALNNKAFVIDWLLSKGLASLSEKNNSGSNALMLAASCGHKEAVEVLIRIDKSNMLSSPENRRNIDGLTAFHWAAISGDINILSILLNKADSIDESTNNGYTALMLATMNNKTEAVLWLIQRGANLDVRSHDNKTAVLLAVEKKYHDITILLRKKADDNVKLDAHFEYLKNEQNVDKVSQLIYKDGDIECNENLLTQNSDINVKDKYGISPLYNAVKNSNYKAVETLIKWDADVNIRTNIGWTPLHCACELGDRKIAKMLIEYNAEIEARNADNKSPLHIAVEVGKIEVVKLLIENHVNIEATDKENNTPLHLAAKNGFVEIIEFLLKNLANINARNMINDTPLQVAIKNNRTVAALLLENVATSRKETLPEMPSESDSKTIEILQKPVTTNKELKSLNSDSNVLKVNLVQAITGRKLQEVKSILESNPNLFYLPLQENNRTALLLAHEKNSSKVVEVIISTMGGKDKVTDILIEDRNLNHTFYTAVKLFRTATINSFLSNFSLKDKISHIALPRVSSSLSFDQATLNEKLLDAVEQGYPILVELLLHFGADIHVKSLHHQTSGELIHTAASRGHIEILNLFLNKGFDVDELDENNNTPLHIACSSNNSNISVIKWLIEKGADILCKNDEGDCPIHAAINSEKSADDKLKIISLMIDKNKNILNIEDAIGNSTVLHIAAEQGLDDIVELLIIVGADFTKTNAEGKNVKEIARNKGKIEEIIRTNQNVISQGLRQISYHQIILGERIGHGSFGDVYKSTWLGKEVAVKQLRTNILNISDEAKEQFLNEARIISSKQHPNIINMIGVTIQPHYCLIMNYMEKGDLFNYIHKNSITWDFSIKISKDISTGLEFLHSEKILHRDLKTSNIIIDNNMNAKITDFGLSKIKEDTINASTIGTLRICGTPGYIAPEIYEQGNKKQSGISARIHYTRESDMYSYGVILWELATKQIPSENRDDEAEMELIPSNCSFKYAALIKACWSKNTKARPTVAKVLNIFNKINIADFKGAPGQSEKKSEAIEISRLENEDIKSYNVRIENHFDKVNEDFNIKERLDRIDQTRSETIESELFYTISI